MSNFKGIKANLVAMGVCVVAAGFGAGCGSIDAISGEDIINDAIELNGDPIADDEAGVDAENARRRKCGDPRLRSSKTVRFSLDATEGPGPLEVTGFALPVDDEGLPSGRWVKYSWNFDGETESGPMETHAVRSHLFSTPGLHTVSLCVTVGWFTWGCLDVQSEQREIHVNVYPLISGTVYDAGLEPIEGVVVSANNVQGGATVVTDADGQYQLNVPYGWSGTVTPDDADHTFFPSVRLNARYKADHSLLPSARTYENLTSNQTGQDFESEDPGIEPLLTCLSDADCSDGLFCNGVETCDNGHCVPGTSPCPDVESCNEDTAECMVDPSTCGLDVDCDDGLFCNGGETCVVGVCQSGSSPCGAGLTCDEDTSTCVDLLACALDSDCDDGLFCNGAETCVNGECSVSNAPCAAGEICLEEDDSCFTGEVYSIAGLPIELEGTIPESAQADLTLNVIPADATAIEIVLTVYDADNPNEGELLVNGQGGVGLFGDQGLDPYDRISLTLAPLTLDIALFQLGSNTLTFTHEATNGYVIEDLLISFVSTSNSGDCSNNADCSDGLYCNGAETCVNGACAIGSAPCANGQICNESTDACEAAPATCSIDSDCDDGLYCNGTETCVLDSCSSGAVPCAAGEICNESSDSCAAAPGNVYYVDDDGPAQAAYASGDAVGSINNPYSSIQSAANTVVPGDTVIIKAGTYYAPNGSYLTPVLDITLSGTAQAPIRFQNYQNDIVFLDAEATHSTSNNGHRRGINIGAGYSYIEISGLVVKNAFREGIGVYGAHILLEDCIVENCGLNPNNGESSGIKFDASQFFTAKRVVTRYCYNGFGARHAKDSYIEDCLSYRNGVTVNGDVIYPENANGFQTGVARNGSDRVTFKRCVSWGNADDGWDCSHSRDILLDECIAFRMNDLNLPDGDGGGYKIGNDQNETDPMRQMRRVLIRGSFAFLNKSNGIDARDGIDALFYNNTASANNGQFGISTGSSGHAASFFNNLSWNNLQSDLFKADNAKTADYNNWANNSGDQVPGSDLNSIRQDPGFANPNSTIDTSWQGGFGLYDVRGNLPTLNNIRNQVLANFALSNFDPATTSVDRGTFITFTSSAGSGTNQIPVQHNPQVRFRVGDQIQIEGAGTAKIQSMSASTITIDSFLSFSSGAGVHTPWNGAAPDIGAVETP